MNNDKALKEELRALLTHKKSRSFYAERLGISKAKVAELQEEIHQEREESDNSDQEVEISHDKDRQELKIKGTSSIEITDLDTFLREGKVDLDVWQVKQFWQMYKKGRWHFSVFLVQRSLTEMNLDEVMARLKSVFLENPKRIPLASADYTNQLALVVYVSDEHVAAYVSEDDLYNNPWDEKVYRQRKISVLEAIRDKVNIYGPFKKIVICNLGDSLDGYQSQTTRGGHRLPQNMSDRKAFDVYLEANKEWWDTLLDSSFAHSYEFRCQSNDNHCYTSEVEALTDSGFKKFTDISPTDKIATVNPVTNEMEYQLPIQRIYNKPATREIHYYKSKNIDLPVTSQHRMWMKLSKYDKAKEQFEFITSEDYISKSRGDVKIKTALSNTIGDFDIQDNFIRLAAWIASDGTITKNREYIIWQREEKKHLIEQVLNELGIGYVLRKKNNKVNAICGKHLVEQPDQMYGIHLNKKHTDDWFLRYLKQMIPHKYQLPSWLNKLSVRQFNIYLQSFIDGDGSRKKGSNNSATIYGIKGILDQLQVLCIKNGIRASISEYRKGTFRLNVCFNRLESTFKGTPIIEKYNGYTWCFTMSYGNFIVRHNGKVAIQGNSGAFGYAVQRAIETYLNAVYPQVDTYIYRKFIEHFNVGIHTIMLCHGKDEKNRMVNLPFQLNDRATIFIKDYMDYHSIKADKKIVHFCKGDLHKEGMEHGRGFRYRNTLSLFGASGWIMDNFGHNDAGCSMDIYDLNNPHVLEDRVWLK